jgi:hypothetical protein
MPGVAKWARRGEVLATRGRPISHHGTLRAMADPTERTDETLAIPPGPGQVPARSAPRSVTTGGPAGNGRPSSPEDMRDEIQQTRARMSMTLDAIEEQLVQQKRELWAKATLQPFRRKISTEPWRSMAIAFAAGYIVAAIRD